ncbi:MAG: DHH family phosphoesterase [Planctomycetes bacterium]|nr:DHH family phosphoesterase [Planctomycetota bacterium]
MSASVSTAHNGVPAELPETLRRGQRVALAGHVTPDADCLGSIGAMWLALPELGLYPHVAMPAGSVSRKLEFLAEMAGWRAATARELAECDLALVLDTAKDRRVNVEGKLAALPNAAVLNVDHHASNERYGRVNWVDGHRSSACEMAYELIRSLGCQVTPTLATLLYAGLHSDTQGFSLSNTTPRSLQVGHELAHAGARVAEVCERLHRSRSRGEFELVQVVYRNTHVSDDGRLAWSTISNAEMAHTGCGPNDIDDQVEIVRSIEGISVAILFSEGNAGKIRMNFRGERGASILALAKSFGGGGHEASAGAIMDGSIESVTQRVIPEALRFAADIPSHTSL